MNRRPASAPALRKRRLARPFLKHGHLMAGNFCVISVKSVRIGAQLCRFENQHLLVLLSAEVTEYRDTVRRQRLRILL